MVAVMKNEAALRHVVQQQPGIVKAEVVTIILNRAFWEVCHLFAMCLVPSNSKSTCPHAMLLHVALTCL